MKRTTPWYACRIEKDGKEVFQARRAHEDTENPLATLIQKEDQYFEDQDEARAHVAELNRIAKEKGELSS